MGRRFQQIDSVGMRRLACKAGKSKPMTSLFIISHQVTSSPTPAPISEDCAAVHALCPCVSYLLLFSKFSAPAHRHCQESQIECSRVSTEVSLCLFLMHFCAAGHVYSNYCECRACCFRAVACAGSLRCLIGMVREHECHPLCQMRLS